MRKLLVALAALLMTGCSTAPAVRPVTAVAMVLQDPAVGAWYEAHSARKYRPAVAVDLVKEGLQVKLESRFGPGPHQVVVLLDRPTGRVLQVVYGP